MYACVMYPYVLVNHTANIIVLLFAMCTTCHTKILRKKVKNNKNDYLNIKLYFMKLRKFYHCH